MLQGRPTSLVLAKLKSISGSLANPKLFSTLTKALGDIGAAAHATLAAFESIFVSMDKFFKLDLSVAPAEIREWRESFNDSAPHVNRSFGDALQSHAAAFNSIIAEIRRQVSDAPYSATCKTALPSCPPSESFYFGDKNQIIETAMSAHTHAKLSLEKS